MLEDSMERIKMPNQAPSTRICNFKEVALGYSKEQAVLEASRCLNCKNAPCSKGCPVGVKIPKFIEMVKVGDIEGAYGVISLDNNLPAICGRVCPQENQCEKLCVRRDNLGGSVSIGALERFVADYALDRGIKAEKRESNQSKVAIVGSGPAGLTCAIDLAKAGVQVVIYEALHSLGGVLVYGIPEFRLPKVLVEKEIEKLKDLGVQIETNVVVGKTIFIDELLEENDAVFIGSGAGLPMFMGIKGENLNGIYSANEYLTRVNLMKAYQDSSATPILRGKSVVVVGAGNVAMDSARTARRLGADVTIVYRRGKEEMPARAEEILHAEEEGIKFSLLTNPVEFIGENGKVSAVKVVKMELGAPDNSGRRRPVPIAGSEYDIPCDQVIVALGTSPNPIIKNSMPTLELTERGTIKTDEDGRTTIPRLYAGGDATTGSATVILAMGAGKKSAKAILKQLQIDEK
ncbi:MAG: NADPH-dependent glutamate synthase [Clostridia bacterium]|nr:NADPH-dependent glutamate synthase [Clostridia bacterium]